jgi:hypothetical protein
MHSPCGWSAVSGARKGIRSPQVLASWKRLATLPPAPGLRRWSEAEPAQELIDGYRRLLGNLLAQPYDPKAFCGTLTLSGEAKDLWVDWYNRWGRRQAAAGGDGEKALLAKLEGGAARFALLGHVLSHVGTCTTPKSLQNFEVSPVALQAGTALAEWFAYESERVYATLAETDEEREARELRGWISKRPGRRATARDLCTYLDRRYPTAADAEAALQMLVTAGWGEWVPVPPGERGGQPTRYFQLRTCTTPEFR